MGLPLAGWLDGSLYWVWWFLKLGSPWGLDPSLGFIWKFCRLIWLVSAFPLLEYHLKNIHTLSYSDSCDRTNFRDGCGNTLGSRFPGDTILHHRPRSNWWGWVLLGICWFRSPRLALCFLLCWRNKGKNSWRTSSAIWIKKESGINFTWCLLIFYIIVSFKVIPPPNWQTFFLIIFIDS